MVRAPVDMVDHVVAQWKAVRPEIDTSPMHIVARVSRLSRLIDRRLSENFARFGIEDWMYDVLATLRRNGAPYELAAGELVGQTMVTTGAITNRIDRLEQRSLVERVIGEDRRKVIVRLTPKGLKLVDEIVRTHMDAEDEILAPLSPRQREELTKLLRTTLLGMGDV
jgi:DNA-binding MarR family transcriptional regulator